ncbi:MAG: N-acetyl-gamma-glutamyl-phosphate reductase [Deltaproteobacteria bacterium]|nr:N-acetyl-gamma-glutamyl-phosphate reductase [Deltaproteobacteria bacterium]
MTRVPVGVVGASGFLGGELIRLLVAHPEIELAMLCGARSAGQKIGALRPSLAALPHVVEAVNAEALAARCEVVFCAMPHGESATLTAELLALHETVRVIDLGSDFRLRDPAGYPRYYGRQHPHPELLEQAFYALPELTGGAPREARIIANPGCFATALALGITPLAAAMKTSARIAISGVTGSSGSGAAPGPGVHHALRLTNLRAYKPLAHQHLGELRQTLREVAQNEVAVDFVPHSGPMARGIHLTMHIRRNELEGDALSLLEAAYAKSALVQVQQGPVAMGAVLGSCRVEIGVAQDAEAIVVFVAIDNLLKGGSGQALQNLNLWLGLEETLGLPLCGVWP